MQSDDDADPPSGQAAGRTATDETNAHDVAVDDTDRRIVNALLGDGRASAREVAAETGLAATTVSNRLSDLKGAGVIESYEPRIDYTAFGYDVTAVFHLDVDGEGLERVVGTLREDDRMVAVYEVTGSDDVIAVGKFTNSDEMSESITDLVTDPHVVATSTNVVLETVRDCEQFPVDLDG
jgi:DNA-binding Lrp family transcriptional regulator